MIIKKQSVPKVIVENEVLWNFLDIEMLPELGDTLEDGYYMYSADLESYLDSFIEWMYRRYDEYEDGAIIDELLNEVDALFEYTKREASIVIFISNR